MDLTLRNSQVLKVADVAQNRGNFESLLVLFDRSRVDVATGCADATASPENLSIRHCSWRHKGKWTSYTELVKHCCASLAYNKAVVAWITFPILQTTVQLLW
jgi:hypothetical protein